MIYVSWEARLDGMSSLLGNTFLRPLENLISLYQGYEQKLGLPESVTPQSVDPIHHNHSHHNHYYNSRTLMEKDESVDRINLSTSGSANLSNILEEARLISPSVQSGRNYADISTPRPEGCSDSAGKVKAKAFDPHCMNGIVSLSAFHNCLMIALG